MTTTGDLLPIWLKTRVDSGTTPQVGIAAVAGHLIGKIQINSDDRLYIGEDNIIWWKGMKEIGKDEFVNIATAAFTLKLAKDESVFSNLLNVSMGHIANSDGDFKGVIEETQAGFDRDEYYILEVTAKEQSGADGFRRIIIPAIYHEWGP